MWYRLSTAVHHPGRARRSVHLRPTPERLEERALLSSGPAVSNFAYKVALDSAGNTYAIGQFTGIVDFGPGPTDEHLQLTDQNPNPPSGWIMGTDGFLAKYDPDGNLLWVERTDAQGADNYGVLALAIGKDPASNQEIIYVITANTGFVPTGTEPTSAIRAFDPADGSQMWTIPLPPCTSRPSIEADATGVYLFQEMAGSDTGITYTFDPAIPPDPSSKVTVTELDSNEITACAAHYDSAGLYKWVTRVGATGGDHSTFSMALGDNSVYVAGNFSGSLSVDDGTVLTNDPAHPGGYIVKLNAGNGTPIFKVDDQGKLVPDALALEQQSVTAICYDSDYLYLTLKEDRRIEKVDPGTGDAIWTVSTQESTMEPYVQSMAVADGLCYSTGFFRNTVDFDATATRPDDTLTASGSWDGFVWAVNAEDGSFAWVHGYGGTNNDWYAQTNDVGWGIAAGGSRVAVAGQFDASQVSFGNGLTLETSTDLDGYVLSLDSQQGSSTWVRQIGVPGTDTTPPTITALSPLGTPVASVDVTFSEPVDTTTLTPSVVTLTRDDSGLALSGLSFSLVAGTTYRLSGLARFTSAGGTYVLTLDMTQIKDKAGNLGTEPASTSWVVDKTGPTASFTAVAPDPRNTPVSSVDVVFSESIDETTLTPAEVSLTRDGTPVELAGLGLILVEGDTYRFSGLASFTANEGTYRLKLEMTHIKDKAGNRGTEPASTSWVVDKTGPTASFTAVVPDPRKTSVPNIDVVFSESIDATTLTTDAVSLTRDGTPVDVSGLELTPGEGNTYSIIGLGDFTADEGTYVLKVDMTTVKDLAGNSGAGIAAQTWVMAIPGPTALATAVKPDPRKTAVPSVDFVFSEPISAKTFTAAAVSLTRNGKAVRLRGLTTRLVSGNTYRIAGLARFTGAAGAYMLQVDLTKVRDLDGRAGLGTASESWVLDLTRPTAKVTAVAPDPRNTAVSEVSVTFSEPISPKTFTAAAVRLTRNGKAVALRGLTIRLVSGHTYQVAGLASLTTTAGTYTLRVDMTQVIDLAGNRGSGFALDTWVMKPKGV